MTEAVVDDRINYWDIIFVDPQSKAVDFEIQSTPFSFINMHPKSPKTKSRQRETKGVYWRASVESISVRPRVPPSLLSHVCSNKETDVNLQRKLN